MTSAEFRLSWPWGSQGVRCRRIGTSVGLIPSREPMGAGMLQLGCKFTAGVRVGASVTSERDGGSAFGILMASGCMCSCRSSLSSVLHGEPSPVTTTVLDTLGLMVGLGGWREQLPLLLVSITGYVPSLSSLPHIGLCQKERTKHFRWNIINWILMKHYNLENQNNYKELLLQNKNKTCIIITPNGSLSFIQTKLKCQ